MSTVSFSRNVIRRLAAGARFRAPALLIVPYVLFLIVIFVLPVGFIAKRSLNDPTLTLAHYARLTSEPVYGRVFLNTALLAGAVTIVCLTLGYPLALTMFLSKARVRRALLACVVIPFWTSILVRSYAWLVLLQQQGIVNKTLMALHATTRPLSLLYNAASVVIGMAYVLLPLMTLTLFSSLSTIDPRLSIAAATLGASRSAIFRRVLLPLSRPGILAGATLVFVLALGFFITPALLGGPAHTTVGMLIDVQMNRLLDWGFGSALAMSLTFTVCLLVALGGSNLHVRLLSGSQRRA